MAKKVKSTSAEEHKVEVWKACIEEGWVRQGINALYKTAPNGKRTRLSFREDSCLIAEERVEKTAQEVKEAPGMNPMKWSETKRIAYKDIKVGEKGALVFPEEEKEVEEKGKKKGDK